MAEKLTDYFDKLYIKEEDMPSYNNPTQEDIKEEEDKDKEEKSEEKEESKEEEKKEEKEEGKDKEEKPEEKSSEEDKKEDNKEEKKDDDENKKKEDAKMLSKLTKEKVITQLDNCNDKDLETILYAVLDAKSSLKKKQVNKLVKDRDDKCAVGDNCGETEKKMEDKKNKGEKLNEEVKKGETAKPDKKPAPQPQKKQEKDVQKEQDEKLLKRMQDLAGLPLNEKWKKDVDIEKTGEHEGKSIETLESEIKAIKERKGKWADVDGKTAKKEISERYFAIRAKKDWPKGKKSVKVGK